MGSWVNWLTTCFARRQVLKGTMRIRVPPAPPYGLVEKWLTRLDGIEEIKGSNPFRSRSVMASRLCVAPIIHSLWLAKNLSKIRLCNSIWLECKHDMLEVGGSSPSEGTSSWRGNKVAFDHAYKAKLVWLRRYTVRILRRFESCRYGYFLGG